MSRHSIAVIVGSLRKDSFNRRLADAFPTLAPQDFEFRQLRIDDLPLYNQDDDANQHANVKRLKAEVKAASGVIFVTPEYNRSMPGVLKNAIDHASRPYGQSAWEGKPAGVIGFRRRDWHRCRPAAPEEHARLPRHADARAAGDLPPGRAPVREVGGVFRQGSRGGAEMDRSVLRVGQGSRSGTCRGPPGGVKPG